MSRGREYEILKPEKYLECTSCPLIEGQIEIASREDFDPGSLIRIVIKCYDSGHKVVLDKNNNPLEAPNTVMEVGKTVYFLRTESEYDYPLSFVEVDCPHDIPSK